MTKMPLEKSFYSLHFVILKYLGCWVVEASSPKIVNAYSVYKLFMSSMAIFIGVLVCLDFWDVYGDLKRMSWNLSINLLIVVGFIKNCFSINKSGVINSMRRKLHRIATESQSPEDQSINELGEKEMKLIQFMFYGAAVSFMPLWIGSWYFSYLWGPRGFPVPIYVPFLRDDDELLYNVIYVWISLFGCAGATVVMENELAMFTLLVQISREYSRLLKNLKKVNELFEGESREEASNREVNLVLRRMRIKSLMREYCKDQRDVIKYTNDFEFSYSNSMLIQMFMLPVMMINLSILCIMEYDSLSVNISYQMACLLLILADMFLVCWFATKINEQCFRVGEEAYSILWYQMNNDIRKDVYLIIMRSQSPPKITSGKLMELNLNAFMILIRNVYSWITLFQQLAFKSDN